MEYGLSDLLLVLDSIITYVTDNSYDSRGQKYRLKIIQYWLSEYRSRALDKHQDLFRKNGKKYFTTTDLGQISRDLNLSNVMVKNVVDELRNHPILGEVFSLMTREQHNIKARTRNAEKDKEYQETIFNQAGHRSIGTMEELL